MSVWNPNGLGRWPIDRICLAFALALTALAQDHPSSSEPSLTAEIAAEGCTEDISPVVWSAAQQPSGITILRPIPGAKRLFGIIPNYRADQYQAVYSPLSPRQKYDIARKDSFDWPNYFLLVGYALQSQIAARGFSHNGGIEGFGEYYARAFGDQVIGAYVTEAILPSLLHEDPRFFRLGTGSFWHRASYAVTRIFVTRTDDGHSRLFVSEVAGNALVVGLTTLYYPASQSASEAIARYSQQLGNDAISNVLTEFWPDIRRHLRFHKAGVP